jgi:hypothetical protein
MEALDPYSNKIHSPLYDRRLMILILKKTNGRSFSENCRTSKIPRESRYRDNAPVKDLAKERKIKETKDAESPRA